MKMDYTTKITPHTHPELYKPGIIFTNAPYRSFFYHIEVITSHDPLMYWNSNRNCPMLNVLSKGGIEISKEVN